MRIRSASIALLAVLAAGCGTSSQSSTTAATEPQTTIGTTTVSGPPTVLTVFQAEHGTLRARAKQVPQTHAVATAALHALGFAVAVSIADGTASVQLAVATPAEVAEIVYTLTQYRSVQRVDVANRTGLTRASVGQFVPPILVESPGSNARVGTTFRVAGSASVFEATLVVELRQAGRVIQKQVATASEGAPGRGTFAVHLTAPDAGDYVVAAYAPSAADGTPQHEQDLPVTVG